MERQTISQLVKGALEELEKQCYARISINNYKQMFNRFVRYAGKKGETILTDSVARNYLLDTYGWDINSNAKPSVYVTSQLRAIRILMCCATRKVVVFREGSLRPLNHRRASKITMTCIYQNAPVGAFPMLL